MDHPQIEASVAECLAHQYGVITVGQARQAGMSMRMVQYRLDSGRWRRLANGVYAVASSPPTWHQRLAAALLFHPTAIVTGRSAARLHGFPGIRSGRPEVMVPRTANARSPLGTVTRSAFFHQVFTVRVDGFVVASPAEAILALAAFLPLDRLAALLDETLVKQTAALADYETILDRIAGGRVRGSRPLRELVEERRPGAFQPPTSELERLSRRLTEHPAIPLSSHQHPMLGSAGPMVVDTFIADWGLVLEVDGRNYHTRKADFERDRRRDNAAAAMGLVVLRFTWSMLVDDFDYCRETLLATGRQRSRPTSA
ncbi:MAG TPA: type IV toxin-antitoxin system AbiEi family antitoxin domain-containing protein [Acidimicrobiia bacterium]|nr:type IV toxin-antitoxin system AbiEi family antitoxin domain-containing protein [Acidimicrobiia bacterium]